MVTPASTRILTLVLALTATTAFADDFMLGPGRIMSDPVRPSADCDNNPAEPAASSGATARVIYHDGQNAPVSVPVNPRGIDGTPGAASGADSTTGGAGTADAADTASPASSPRLPSAEPSVPQKPRNGLRWQSVLPGSIK